MQERLIDWIVLFFLIGNTITAHGSPANYFEQFLTNNRHGSCPTCSRDCPAALWGARPVFDEVPYSRKYRYLEERFREPEEFKKWSNDFSQFENPFVRFQRAPGTGSAGSRSVPASTGERYYPENSFDPRRTSRIGPYSTPATATPPLNYQKQMEATNPIQNYDHSQKYLNNFDPRQVLNRNYPARQDQQEMKISRDLPDYFEILEILTKDTPRKNIDKPMKINRNFYEYNSEPNEFLGLQNFRGLERAGKTHKDKPEDILEFQVIEIPIKSVKDNSKSDSFKNYVGIEEILAGFEKPSTKNSQNIEKFNQNTNLDIYRNIFQNSESRTRSNEKIKNHQPQRFVDTQNIDTSRQRNYVKNVESYPRNLAMPNLDGYKNLLVSETPFGSTNVNSKIQFNEKPANYRFQENYDPQSIEMPQKNQLNELLLIHQAPNKMIANKNTVKQQANVARSISPSTKLENNLMTGIQKSRIPESKNSYVPKKYSESDEMSPEIEDYEMFEIIPGLPEVSFGKIHHFEIEDFPEDISTGYSQELQNSQEIFDDLNYDESLDFGMDEIARENGNSKTVDKTENTEIIGKKSENEEANKFEDAITGNSEDKLKREESFSTDAKKNDAGNKEIEDVDPGLIEEIENPRTEATSIKSIDKDTHIQN